MGCYYRSSGGCHVQSYWEKLQIIYPEDKPWNHGPYFSLRTLSKHWVAVVRNTHRMGAPCSSDFTTPLCTVGFWELFPAAQILSSCGLSKNQPQSTSPNILKVHSFHVADHLATKSRSIGNACLQIFSCDMITDDASDIPRKEVHVTVTVNPWVEDWEESQ